MVNANGIFLLDGAAYLVIAGIIFFNAWRVRKKQPGAAPLNDGRWLFLFTGSVLLLGFCINTWVASKCCVTHSVANWGLVSSIIAQAIAYFPWLMLLGLKKYRPLRKSGLLGLCIVLTPTIVMVMRGWG